MSNEDVSTDGPDAQGAPPAQLKAVPSLPLADLGGIVTVPIADRLAAAARAVRDAAALGLGAPVSVNVTDQGCSAVLDTEGVLGWARLASPRPTVTTHPGSAYLLLDATIAGMPWKLHNGVPAPSAAKPSPRPRHEEAVA